MPQACIALGSNLGNREAHLREGLARLQALGVRVLAVSRFIETAAVGAPPGAEHLSYLNAAAKVETSLTPQDLMRTLLEVEQDLGRERREGERNAPRTLDLDLLLYEDRAIETPSLRVPHPRMHERAFVLRPLAEVAPDARHPLLGKTVKELLAELDAGQTQPENQPTR